MSSKPSRDKLPERETTSDPSSAMPPALRSSRPRRGRAWLWVALSLSCGALHFAPPAVAWAGSAASQLDVALPRSQVLRRTLQSDARQEYYLYLAADAGEDAPLFVAVHGISCNALEHATLFSRYAEAYGVVLLAPVFCEPQHDDYQRLGRSGRGKRSDKALDAMVDEVRRLTGISAAKIHLFGFSGGAQFAHRYVMAHPDRVARAVIAAAGWYTFPDPATPYPYGIGASADLPSVVFDPERFLRVPMLVLVGEKDLTNESLRRNKTVDEQQGVTRFARAQNWVAAMRAAAQQRQCEPIVSYEQVPGIQHSFKQFMLDGQLGDRTFAALFGRR